jgi:2-keto-4-pentenoate hydratase
LIYPGGIARRGGELRPDIAEKLQTGATPETFIVHAFADASMNSLALAIELKRKRIPCEMHIYQEGGHGFGARDSALPLNGWKASYVQWIRAQGFLDPPYVAKYAGELIRQLSGTEPIQPLSRLYPGANLTDAYAVQRKLVRAQTSSDAIMGYKAGYVTKQSQHAVGLSGPLTGVLFRSGQINVEGPVVLQSAELGPSAIETELGFVVSNGLDISTRIATEKQIKGAFELVVPVIELPTSLSQRMTGDLKAVDIAAANIGSKRILVASNRTSPDDYRPEELNIVLTKDGNELHSVRGDTIYRGLWRHLITVVNQLVDQRYTLRGGDIVIAGALGQVHPAQVGKYAADYGSLGKVEFTIK